MNDKQERLNKAYIWVNIDFDKGDILTLPEYR